MKKRGMVIGGYDTAANGWTLTSWKLADAVQKTNIVDRPNGDGSWDLSTAMTDGIPRYNDRALTATFECSEGDRLSRDAKIDDMINQLEGMVEPIYLPDDGTMRHVVGHTIHVAVNYSDLAHASVTVTATCEPWKYRNTDTVVLLEASAVKGMARLVNGGRRVVVPIITVTGADAQVLLEYGTASLSLAAGTHKWPALVLTPGAHVLTYSGSGTVTITYREAVLR